MTMRSPSTFWIFSLMLGVVLSGTSAPILNAQINAQTTPAIARKQDYRPIPLSNLQRSGSLIDKDPRRLIYRFFASTDEFPRSETLQIDYQGGERKTAAIAIFTKSGLLDDSVSAFRYYIELNRQPNGQWQLIWAGSQNQCVEGRGPSSWTNKLCS